jgi:hypothetical protein
MKRSLALSLTLAAAFAVARAEDPKPDEKPPAKKVDATKAPEPSKALPVGTVLPAGTIKREKLFPLEEGRTWTYELKVWLAITAAEGEATPEESEPPRTHRLEVSMGESAKIDSKDARCLDYRLDGELTQRAYYFDEGATVSCPRRILLPGEHQRDYALTPAQPTLQGDLAVGSKWPWSGKIGSSKATQNFEVLREEKIKVPARPDEVSALVIKMTFSGDDESTGCSVKWYVPDIGLVREETEVKADQQTYKTLAVLTKSESKAH